MSARTVVVLIGSCVEVRMQLQHWEIDAFGCIDVRSVVVQSSN